MSLSKSDERLEFLILSAATNDATRIIRMITNSVTTIHLLFELPYYI